MKWEILRKNLQCDKAICRSEQTLWIYMSWKYFMQGGAPNHVGLPFDQSLQSFDLK